MVKELFAVHTCTPTIASAVHKGKKRFRIKSECCTRIYRQREKSFNNDSEIDRCHKLL